VINARQMRRTSDTPATLSILAACCVVFFLQLVLPRGSENQLATPGAQINTAVLQGDWWRLFTSAFLHGGTMHILFNMWALWVFGPDLERRVGSVPFVVLYLSSAVAGGAAFFFLAGLDAGPAVGASGAIFGLFGAWIAEALRQRHTSAGRASLNQLLVLLGINAALPLLIPYIAWQAHLGGLVAGFSIALLWGAFAQGRSRAPARILIASAFGMAGLALVVLF
jgi:membrane associated rhomboid family serine protease